jgi:hypothetical protein
MEQPSVRGSAKTASHSSSGKGSLGAGSGFSRAAPRASFSIWRGDGIRQLAGRSFVMSKLEQKGNE